MEVFDETYYGFGDYPDVMAEWNAVKAVPPRPRKASPQMPTDPNPRRIAPTV